MGQGPGDSTPPCCYETRAPTTASTASARTPSERPLDELASIFDASERGRGGRSPLTPSGPTPAGPEGARGHGARLPDSARFDSSCVIPPGCHQVRRFLSRCNAAAATGWFTNEGIYLSVVGVASTGGGWGGGSEQGTNGKKA